MKNKTDIIWLDSIDSTNDEARRRILTLDNLSVLSALEQTGGRGQRENKWHSAPNQNLTFSIVLKNPPVNAADQFCISEITAVTLVNFLSEYGIEADIKWPNDIYVSGKKICGILIENSLKYAGSAEVSLYFDQYGLCIEVSDNGPGIPENMLEKVLEPWFRVENSRNRETGGSGLGLAIAKNMATLSGAQLLLQNRTNGGLRASIRFHA